MTVSTEIVDHSYKPGAAMAPEAIPFQFLDAADLAVVHVDATTGARTDLAQGVDYEIAGNGMAVPGLESPATITASAAWPVDDDFYLVRDSHLQQQAQIRAGQPLPAADLEATLDRVVMVAQETVARSLRSFRVPAGEAAPELPDAAGRAGRYFAFGPGPDALPAMSAGTGNDLALRTDLADEADGLNAGLIAFKHGGVHGAGSLARRLNYFPVDPRINPWFAGTSGQDVAALLQSILDDGYSIESDFAVQYAIGSQIALRFDHQRFLGMRLKMLTGAGKFDASDNVGGYTTNRTGILIDGLWQPQTSIIVEMEAAPGLVRTCNALSVLNCEDEKTCVEAFGFAEALFPVTTWNTNIGGQVKAYVHDCTTNDVTLPSLQLTGVGLDMDRPGGVNSIAPKFKAVVRNMRFGAAARAARNEQTDGMNVGSQGWLGAKIQLYAENMGEPFDNFGDGSIIELTSVGALNYGAKMGHGASNNKLTATIKNPACYGLVLFGDNHTKDVVENRCDITVEGVGNPATTPGFAFGFTAAIATDGTSATYKPRYNDFEVSAKGDGVNMDYVVKEDAGNNNHYLIGPSSGWAVAISSIDSGVGANPNIRFKRKNGARAKALAGTTTTITNNTTIIFQNELKDETGQYDHTTGIWLVDMHGRLRIKVKVTADELISGDYVALACYLNGSNRVDLRIERNNSGGTLDFACNAEFLADVVPGDQVTIRAFVNGGPQNILTGADETFIIFEAVD